MQPPANENDTFTARKRRPRWGTLLLVGLFHLLVLVGLARVFAPDFTAAVIDRATALITVTVTAPPKPAPSATAAPKHDEGAAAEAGKKARPKEATAPKVPRPSPTPLPQASSSGAADSSGARAAGEGTGASGSGIGTGSGREGGGVAGLAVTRPVKIAGDINDTTDYPTPPGGRQIRWGHSVTVYMTVGTDGRASNCRVVSPSPDPEADRITCQLAVERFRFRPATDANGNPVAATYGWRQSWFAR